MRAVNQHFPTVVYYGLYPGRTTPMWSRSRKYPLKTSLFFFLSLHHFCFVHCVRAEEEVCGGILGGELQESSVPQAVPRAGGAERASKGRSDRTKQRGK